jgi:hypothetical protein
LGYALPALDGVTQAAQHCKQSGDRTDTDLIFVFIPFSGISHGISRQLIYSLNETENSHRFSEIGH